jgi:hypothetical protein
MAPGAFESGTKITINRAPVLTLWAAMVAERLGYDRDEAVTLGRALAGLNAASKARSLGITRSGEPIAAGAEAAKKPEAAKPRLRSPHEVALMGRHIPVVKTPAGTRATSDARAIDPASVHRYLAKNFGDHLAPARAAMAKLAKSLEKDALDAHAFGLYEKFRPAVPKGVRGWGAKGVLDLNVVVALASRSRRT